MLERDHLPCSCGHRNASHGSYDPERGYVGIGDGPCGFCACPRFEEVPPGQQGKLL